MGYHPSGRHLAGSHKQLLQFNASIIDGVVACASRRSTDSPHDVVNLLVHLLVQSLVYVRPTIHLRFARSTYCGSAKARTALGNEHGNHHI
jgi:hypothetical protein